MRKIKFRGKGVNGEWYYGLLSISQGETGQPKKGYYISNKVGMPWAYQVRPETVGQYTNSEDKNNNEIYEGDILKVDINKFIAPGYLHNKESFNVKISFKNYHWTCSNGKGKSLYNYTTLSYIELEVIGNKYDDPELLEKEGKG